MHGSSSYEKESLDKAICNRLLLNINISHKKTGRTLHLHIFVERFADKRTTSILLLAITDRRTHLVNCEESYKYSDAYIMIITIMNSWLTSLCFYFLQWEGQGHDKEVEDTNGLDDQLVDWTVYISLFFQRRAFDYYVLHSSI